MNDISLLSSRTCTVVKSDIIFNYKCSNIAEIVIYNTLHTEKSCVLESETDPSKIPFINSHILSRGFPRHV